MGKVVLYTAKISPPGRSVELTAKALGLELEIRQVNLLAGEHLKPEYLKLNPQHTVPTIVDQDGTVVYDSHAINVYLVSKYGKDDSLYPQDAVTRVFFARLRFYFEPILYFKSGESPQTKIDYLCRAYQLLEDTLVGPYIVGNGLTVADLSCVSSIASINALFPMDAVKYPKVAAWYARIADSPDFKSIIDADELPAVTRAKLEENRRLK